MLHGDVSMIDCQQTPATRLNSDAICNLCARLIDTYLVLCESCNDLSMASNYNCSVQVICLHCYCETLTIVKKCLPILNLEPSLRYLYLWVLTFEIRAKEHFETERETLVNIVVHGIGRG